MSIRVYNTWSGKKEEFKEGHPGEVRMYVCGPTVYDDSHIGHGRAAVMFDVIYRYFLFRGYKVNYVRNYTDVDDKIINRANNDKVEPALIAERYIKSYEDDMSALGILDSTTKPKVSEHIQDIIDVIKLLIDKGFAYVSGGDVFYSVRKFHRYGALSRRSIDEMQSGARVDINEQKQDPLDFALWKSAKPGEPKWESPWGPGRPGWHIECSAMSAKYLGVPFDIHGGGKDLVFPHHENEIAQSEAAFDKKMVNYWLHNGFVQVNQEKMSKSLGNILLISALLKRYNREALRYFYSSAHWRSPIDFSEDNLLQADDALDRFYQAFFQIEKLTKSRPGEEPLKEGPLFEALGRLEPDFMEAMDDDFNTAQVIGNFNDFLRLLNQSLEDNKFKKKPGAAALLAKSWQELKRLAAILGIFQEAPAEYVSHEKTRGLSILGIDQSEPESRIRARAEARAAKDFSKADAIRAELAAKGIILEDSREGTEWKIDRKKLAEKSKISGGGK